MTNIIIMAFTAWRVQLLNDIFGVSIKGMWQTIEFDHIFVCFFFIERKSVNRGRLGQYLRGKRKETKWVIVNLFRCTKCDKIRALRNHYSLKWLCIYISIYRRRPWGHMKTSTSKSSNSSNWFFSKQNKPLAYVYPRERTYEHSL